MKQLLRQGEIKCNIKLYTIKFNSNFLLDGVDNEIIYIYELNGQAKWVKNFKR